MKRSLDETMSRLEIEEGIKDLLRQMWKHCYRTIYSCQGHPDRHAFVMFKDGDGWFEENAARYGFRKQENSDCCKNNRDVANCCGNCGAGIHGYTVYRA